MDLRLFANLLIGLFLLILLVGLFISSLLHFRIVNSKYKRVHAYYSLLYLPILGVVFGNSLEEILKGGLTPLTVYA
ncbi:MAG: hypothetical protein ACK521_05485 [bacterium]